MASGVVQLHTNKLVSEYDYERTRFKVANRKSTSVVTSNGNGNGHGERNGEDQAPEWIEADVILAADGVKSKARGGMLARQGEKDDGECAGVSL